MGGDASSYFLSGAKSSLKKRLKSGSGGSTGWKRVVRCGEGDRSGLGVATFGDSFFSFAFGFLRVRCVRFGRPSLPRTCDAPVPAAGASIALRIQPDVMKRSLLELVASLTSLPRLRVSTTPVLDGRRRVR